MSQRELDTDRVVRLLTADAVATLGERARGEVLAAAANAEENARRRLEQGDSLAEAQWAFDYYLVNNFQQDVHDTHWDTTWPACPRHPKHPLWYDEDRDAWCCRQDGSTVAALGGLADLRPPAT